MYTVDSTPLANKSSDLQIMLYDQQQVKTFKALYRTTHRLSKHTIPPTGTRFLVPSQANGNEYVIRPRDYE